MAKLKLLIDELLDQKQKHMINFTLFLSKVELKDGKHYYQDIKLSKYKRPIKAVNNHYRKAIVSISDNMESRSEELKQSPVFENMVSLLETQTWPTENINEFVDQEIIKIANHFRDLLSKNGCNLYVINEEWQVLKFFMVPLINTNKNFTYLKLWKRVFLNIDTKKESCNVLDIFEFLLVIPFTNVKLERMFWRMLQVKTGWRNRLNRQCLHVLLCIGRSKHRRV